MPEQETITESSDWDHIIFASAADDLMEADYALLDAMEMEYHRLEEVYLNACDEIEALKLKLAAASRDLRQFRVRPLTPVEEESESVLDVMSPTRLSESPPKLSCPSLPQIPRKPPNVPIKHVRFDDEVRVCLPKPPPPKPAPKPPRRRRWRLPALSADNSAPASKPRPSRARVQPAPVPMSKATATKRGMLHLATGNTRQEERKPWESVERLNEDGLTPKRYKTKPKLSMTELSKKTRDTSILGKVASMSTVKYTVTHDYIRRDYKKRTKLFWKLDPLRLGVDSVTEVDTMSWEDLDLRVEDIHNYVQSVLIERNNPDILRTTRMKIPDSTPGSREQSIVNKSILPPIRT